MTAVPPGTTVAWCPEDLQVAPDELLAHWNYVVLEEIVDERALLRRWPWPVVDQRGRLVWPDDSDQDTTAATIDVDVLRAQLYRANGLERTPRIGDVFAVQDVQESRWRSRHADDLRDLVSGRVHDISADAREAAKIAYTSSLGTVAPPDADDPDREPAVASVRARRAEPLPALDVAAPPSAEAPA
jgi:hypothetical protein